METDILKQFGERVKELRLEKKWSQQELADEASFHKNYIGMVERGERNISLKNIDAIAKALKIHISDLLK